VLADRPDELIRRLRTRASAVERHCHGRTLSHFYNVKLRFFVALPIVTPSLQPCKKHAGSLPLNWGIRQTPLSTQAHTGHGSLFYMLTALVLICSATLAPDLADCTQKNATAVIRIPAEFGSPATCFMHGSAYLAETSLGQELTANDRVKVICVRNETIPASIQRSKRESAP
jgi:hypothetical protein